MTKAHAFALYRLPGSTELKLYLHVDGQSKEHFVLGRFKARKTVRIHADELTRIAQSDKNTLWSMELPWHFMTARNASPKKEDYIKQLRTIVSALKNGEAQKVVLSRTIPFEKQESDSILEAFLQLEKEHPNAFIHLSSHPESGTWLGASPETLLSWKDDEFKTMALAGTLPINSDNWTQKELDEQAYVSRYIQEAIAQIPHEGLYISNRYEKKAGKVKHLCTDISFRSNESPAKIVALLHPTPAVAGTPPDAAIQLIESVEAYDRSYYSGYCGPVELNENGVFFVNLRCAEFCTDQAYAYAGGGILSDSDVEKEWSETEYKSQTILGAFKKL